MVKRQSCIGNTTGRAAGPPLHPVMLQAVLVLLSSVTNVIGTNEAPLLLWCTLVQDLFLTRQVCSKSLMRRRYPPSGRSSHIARPGGIQRPKEVWSACSLTCGTSAQDHERACKQLQNAWQWTQAGCGAKKVAGQQGGCSRQGTCFPAAVWSKVWSASGHSM